MEQYGGVSGPATNGTYTYYLGEISQGTKTSNIHTYTGINMNTCGNIKVALKDKAGNIGEKTEPTDTTYYLNHLAKNGEFIDLKTEVWNRTVGNPEINMECGPVTKGEPINTGLHGGVGWMICGSESNKTRVMTVDSVFYICQLGGFSDDIETIVSNFVKENAKLQEFFPINSTTDYDGTDTCWGGTQGATINISDVICSLGGTHTGGLRQVNWYYIAINGNKDLPFVAKFWDTRTESCTHCGNNYTSYYLTGYQETQKAHKGKMRNTST